MVDTLPLLTLNLMSDTLSMVVSPTGATSESRRRAEAFWQVTGSTYIPDDPERNKEILRRLVTVACQAMTSTGTRIVYPDGSPPEVTNRLVNQLNVDYVPDLTAYSFNQIEFNNNILVENDSPRLDDVWEDAGGQIIAADGPCMRRLAPNLYACTVVNNAVDLVVPAHYDRIDVCFKRGGTVYRGAPANFLRLEEGLFEATSGNHRLAPDNWYTLRGGDAVEIRAVGISANVQIQIRRAYNMVETNALHHVKSIDLSHIAAVCAAQQEIMIDRILEAFRCQDLVSYLNHVQVGNRASAYWNVRLLAGILRVGTAMRLVR